MIVIILVALYSYGVGLIVGYAFGYYRRVS